MAKTGRCSGARWCAKSNAMKNLLCLELINHSRSTRLENPMTPSCPGKVRGCPGEKTQNGHEPAQQNLILDQHFMQMIHRIAPRSAD
jgi:hypothetical protein